VTETGPAEQGPFHVRRCARRLDWQVLGGSIVVYTAPDSQEGAVYLPAHEVGLLDPLRQHDLEQSRSP
jgi:hypothetical protein